MKLVEVPGKAQNEAPHIELVGTPPQIDNLKDLLVSRALGAAARMSSLGNRKNFQNLIDDLLEVNVIRPDYTHLLPKMFDDKTERLRLGVLFKSARIGKIGLQQFTHENSLLAIPPQTLCLNHEGYAASLDEHGRFKTWFSSIDNFPLIKTPEQFLAIEQTDATHFSFRSELAHKESGHSLQAQHKWISLGVLVDGAYSEQHVFPREDFLVIGKDEQGSVAVPQVSPSSPAAGVFVPSPITQFRFVPDANMAVVPPDSVAEAIATGLPPKPEESDRSDWIWRGA